MLAFLVFVLFFAFAFLIQGIFFFFFFDMTKGVCERGRGVMAKAVAETCTGPS